MPNVGETIKAIRMQRGLSQFEVAAKSGIGLSAYQKAEQGQDRSDGGSIKIATLSTSVSIPSGTGGLVNYDVSYANVAPASGYRLVAIACRIGDYEIPYLASDLKSATWIYQINESAKTFTISNTATAWGSYELLATLFFRPV